MFSVFFDTIFPALGDFFGRISAIASNPVNVVIPTLFPALGDSPLYISYVNVFNGNISQLGAFLGDGNQSLFGSILRATIVNLFNAFGAGDLPFWLGLLIVIASFVVIWAIISLLWKLLKIFIPILP